MVFKKFLYSQSGAVTVDWVVLTAAVVGIGIPTVGFVATGTGSLGGGITAALQNATVAQALPSYVADTYPAYFIQNGGNPNVADSRAQGYQNLIDNNIANLDDTALQELYQRYIDHEDGARAAAAAMRQVYSDTGGFDYQAVSQIVTDAGYVMPFDLSNMTRRLENYGGDIEQTAVHLDLYQPVMASFSYAYGEELRRRGAFAS